MIASVFQLQQTMHAFLLMLHLNLPSLLISNAFGEETLLTDREIKSNDSSVRETTIDDLKLCGDVVQEVCSHDSEFILRNVKEIDEKTRVYFFGQAWVRLLTLLRKILECMALLLQLKHTQKSLNKFNIKINHQVTNSPETNQLDLGVWAAFQSVVERLSRRQRQDPDALFAAALST